MVKFMNHTIAEVSDYKVYIKMLHQYRTIHIPRYMINYDSESDSWDNSFEMELPNLSSQQDLLDLILENSENTEDKWVSTKTEKIIVAIEEAIETNALKLKGKGITNKDMRTFIANTLCRNENIVSLDLSCNGLTDVGIECLIHAKNIQELNLRSCELTKWCIKYLKNMENLKKLNFSYNQIADEGLENILKNHKTLQTLEVERCKLTDKSVALINDSLCLKRVNLNINIFSTKGLEMLKNNENLEELEIRTIPGKYLKILSDIRVYREQRCFREIHTFMEGTDEVLGKNSPILKFYKSAGGRQCMNSIFEYLNPVKFKFIG